MGIDKMVDQMEDNNNVPSKEVQELVDGILNGLEKSIKQIREFEAEIANMKESTKEKIEEWMKNIEKIQKYHEENEMVFKMMEGQPLDERKRKLLEDLYIVDQKMTENLSKCKGGLEKYLSIIQELEDSLAIKKMNFILSLMGN